MLRYIYFVLSRLLFYLISELFTIPISSLFNFSLFLTTLGFFLNSDFFVFARDNSPFLAY